MPVFLELFSQLHIVINLAVINRLHRAIFVRNRLPAPRHVDDAQTAMPESNFARDELARAIRPPVSHGRGHPAQQRSVCRRSVEIIDSANSAHLVMTRYFFSDARFASRVSGPLEQPLIQHPAVKSRFFTGDGSLLPGQMAAQISP